MPGCTVQSCLHAQPRPDTSVPLAPGLSELPCPDDKGSQDCSPPSCGPAAQPLHSIALLVRNRASGLFLARKDTRVQIVRSSIPCSPPLGTIWRLLHNPGEHSSHS